MRTPICKLVAILALAAVLSGCDTLSYYAQAAGGQFHILRQRQPIDRLLRDDATDDALRQRLVLVQEARRFAEQELALPLKRNFSTYVDLGRPYVVWNVFATPEFSLDPVTWCYPVAGCVSYRGYFSEAGAERFAASLGDSGHDVYVGGVAAYSTLGWFADSVLNTVINRQDHQLASLIFHELAHQVVYVPGDTVFNESFATTVEREGLRRWMAYRELSDEEADGIIEGIRRDESRREQFVALVQSGSSRLRILYDSDVPEAEMRGRKQAVFADMKAQYAALKQSWGGYTGYDAWFARDLNNAQLSTVSTYFNLVPAFEAMLAQEDHDLPRFYQAVDDLSRLSPAARTAYLRERIPARLTGEL